MNFKLIWLNAIFEGTTGPLSEPSGGVCGVPLGHVHEHRVGDGICITVLAVVVDKLSVWIH